MVQGMTHSANAGGAATPRKGCCDKPNPIAIPMIYELRYAHERATPIHKPKTMCTNCERVELPGIVLHEITVAAIRDFALRPKQTQTSWTWDSLGLPGWRDLVATYAKTEPTRPIVISTILYKDRPAAIAAAIGFVGNAQYKAFPDYDGNSIRVPRFIVDDKLAKIANHGAYAAWIPSTLLNPLEVWTHTDDKSKRHKDQVRRYYMGAYLGPTGYTNHLVIGVDASGQVFNSYSVESVETANATRYGQLAYLGYDPYKICVDGSNILFARFAG